MSLPVGTEFSGASTVLFTDLDGTLLDRDTYDFRKALPALDLARTRRVPIVLCSSKTRAEQTELRARLCIDDPFIVEDGSAIYIQRDYFPFEFASNPVGESLLVIRLAPRYVDVRRAIHEVRAETGIDLEGYGDLDDRAVARLTGLDPAAAARARAREFEETLTTPLSDDQAATVTRALASRGLRLSRGGRFFAVTGASDKGTAACILAELYRRERGPVRLVGIGDSFNDRSLLRAMDEPVLVQKDPSRWEQVDVPGIRRVTGVGPAGWGKFVVELLGGGGA
jgi:mannosyl-3-phosphoglycerate phosphatase